MEFTHRKLRRFIFTLFKERREITKKELSEALISNDKKKSIQEGIEMGNLIGIETISIDEKQDVNQEEIQKTYETT